MRGALKFNAGPRRGFVLPIVILLMLVVGLAATVMLSRADAQARAVNRQITATRVHHASRGIQQAIESWLSQVGGREMGQIIDADGFALALEPGDGTELRIYVFPGQGSLVKEPQERLRASTRRALARVVESLEDEHGEDGAERFFREAGPWQVSFADAHDEVIRAVARAAAPAEAAGDLAGALLEARRSDDPPSRNWINSAINEADLEPDVQRELNTLFTFRPVLYEVVIDVRGAGAAAGQGLLARYRSLAELRVNRSSASQDPYEAAPPFLTWRRVETGPYTDDSPTPPGIADDGLGSARRTP